MPKVKQTDKLSLGCFDIVNLLNDSLRPIPIFTQISLWWLTISYLEKL